MLFARVYEAGGSSDAQKELLAAIGEQLKAPAGTSSSSSDAATAGDGGSSSIMANASRTGSIAADAAADGTGCSSEGWFKLCEEQSGSNKAESLPLHRAVAYGHKQVVSLLLAANADPNLRCCHGFSPLLQVSAAFLQVPASRSVLAWQAAVTWHCPVSC
jgi:hypothetical protein